MNKAIAAAEDTRQFLHFNSAQSSGELPKKWGSSRRREIGRRAAVVIGKGKVFFNGKADREAELQQLVNCWKRCAHCSHRLA